MSIDFPELYAVAKAKAIQLSATNFDSFTLKTTNSDGSQVWTVKWKNSNNTYSYDITFPKGVSALKGDYSSKSELESAFPTGITSEEFAFVKDSDNYFIATYKNSAWNYKLLNNKVVFRKTSTTIDYKFSDEDDSKYREFVKLADIKGDKLKHQWDGTKLKIENPDGTFDDGVSLVGKAPEHIWVDGTSVGFVKPDGTLGDVKNLQGKTGDKGLKGDSPEIYDVYTNSNNDIMFKIKVGGELYEAEFDKGASKIASLVNFGEYMGAFDVDNLPTNIVKGQYWRVKVPFNYNNNNYPSGSIIISNKTKGSLIEKVDFDYYANRGSSVNVKIDEQIETITQDTYQINLTDFNATQDSALVTVSGSTRAGAVILNEGIDYNYTNDNIINITSTKLINGDKVCIKKFKQTRTIPLRVWTSGNNYFKNDLVRDSLTGGVYLATEDISNSTVRPSISATSWANISQVSNIASFTLNSPFGLNDVVIDTTDGFIYQCILPTQKATTHPKDDTTHWKSLVKVGRSAYEEYLVVTTDVPKKTAEEWLASLKGRGMVYKGEFDITKRYFTNEYVRYLGKLYLNVTENPLGITNIIPDSDENIWSILFTGAINPEGIIRDDLSNNLAYTWSTQKLKSEFDLTAKKDSVLQKGNTTPYTPQSDNDVVTLGNVKGLINTNLTLDSVGDGVEYKKSKVVYTQEEKDKIANIQASNKGIAYSKEDLQARYPDGSPTLKSGDTIVVLGNGLNHIFYYTDKWNDSGSQSASTGLTK